MGLEIVYLPGQTPIDEEEKEGIIYRKLLYMWAAMNCALRTGKSF
jgi:hypothetical protein